MNGYIDASIYVLLSAIGFVFIDRLCHHIDPVTALFAMSGIAVICFNLLSINDLKKTYAACFSNKLTFLFMSLALGADWTCIIYATHLSDPFISMAALFVTLAFLGFGKLFYNTRSISNLISMMLLLISLVVLYSTYQLDASQHLIYGLLLGVTAGLAFFIYIILSDVLAKRGQLSTMQLLATRFWVLFVGSYFFLPNHNQVYQVLKDNSMILILLSFASLIVPIFFNQQAIKKLGPISASIIISFVPSVTYFFDSWYNLNFIMSNLIVCIIVSTALILPKLLMIKKPSYSD